ncbi:MAG: hypothetical protein JW929_00460 [Anaerolineales bacterium]|nr:hypothetical protein [Anaerolineales bacterium]
MADDQELESLYTQAKAALSAKDYDRASDLLRQLLAIDENYKDTSRLLARMVRLKRQRWYNNPKSWAALGAVALVGLAVWSAPRLKAFSPSIASPAETTAPSTNPPFTATPYSTSTPELLPAFTSTLIPLRWKRLSTGQEFSRDEITSIVIDPNDPDVVYIGTRNAGIYKSLDGGITLMPIQNGLSFAGISGLAIDPKNPQTLYAGTPSNLIFKTVNGGGAWQAIDTRMENSYAGDTSVLIDPFDNQHIFLAAPDYGWMDSNDGGTTWNETSLSPCPSAIGAFLVHPQVNGKLYATQIREDSDCPAGVFHSTDGGGNWTRLGLEETGIYAMAIGSDPSGREILYASSVGSENRLYASDDGGQNWSELAQIACSALYVNPANPSTMYCHGVNGGYSSTNAGLSWNPLPERCCAPVAFSVDGTRMLGGGEGGLLSSSDSGISWTEIGNGLGNLRIKLKTDPAHESLYAEDAYGYIFHSPDWGIPWQQASPFFGGSYEVEWPRYWLSIGKNGDLYLAHEQTIRISKNQGTTWDFLPAPVDTANRGVLLNVSSREDTLFVSDISMDPNRSLFISMDAGQNWAHNTGEDIPYGRFYFPPAPSEIIYSVDITGYGSPAYVSTDNGASWQLCGLEPEAVPTSVDIVSDDPQRLYLATKGDGILISADGCRSWNPSNDGLGGLFVNSVAVDPFHSEIIYAGTDGGAYVSFDGGIHWGSINDGLLGATVVYSIVIDSQSNVYAATPNGVFLLGANG